MHEEENRHKREVDTGEQKVQIMGKDTGKKSPEGITRLGGRPEKGVTRLTSRGGK